MTYGGNMFGGQPSNNLWVGNNYSTSSYAQMPKNNYTTPANNMNTSFNTQFPPQSINNILQVMGPESAQAYRVGPDSQVILMDSDKPVFYMKRSDNSGYTETRAFEFHEIPLIQTQEIHENTQSTLNYVTKSEFEDFKKMIEDLVMKND